MISEFALQDKTALVAGGARGIGSGIVEVFLEAGANVIVNSLTDKYAKPFVDELNTKYPEKAFGITADATTSDGSGRLIEKAQDIFGPIDILVNCVGDGSYGGSLVPLPAKNGSADVASNMGKYFGTKVYTDSDISKILDLNMMSAIHCTRAAAPSMLERRSGKIINMVSNAAFHGAATNCIYSAGKAGLVGLTKSLALAWAPFGVTVNAICPGIYLDHKVMPKEETDMLEDMFLPKIPLGRLGEFRDIGLLALYLASRAGDYMTGQVVRLDGGMELR